MNKDFIIQVKNTLVVHKKKLWGMVMFVAFLGIFSAGAHTMFRVNGVVTGLDKNSVTVANFFRTQTVDLTGSPVNMTTIKPGDKVKIEKNLQGKVLSIRIKTNEHDEQEFKHRRG